MYRYTLYNSLHPKREKFGGREVTKRHDSDNEEYAAGNEPSGGLSIFLDEISIFIWRDIPKIRTL